MSYKKYAHVQCADGFKMSVQAHQGAYCEPKRDWGPYTEVEIGYPSDPEIMIMRWAEDKSRPTDTVYGWVPVGVVRDVIAKHGGAVSGEVPDGVLMLMAPTSHSLDNF